MVFLSLSSSANPCIFGQTPKLSVSQAVTLAPAARGAEYTNFSLGSLLGPVSLTASGQVCFPQLTKRYL